MTFENIPIDCGSPGRTHLLPVYRFGSHLNGPKLYLQAGLHADEAPGMLVLHFFMRELERIEASGGLLGEVIVVPLANPIGLGQFIAGQAFGRFALADGVNFNRGFVDLFSAAQGLLASAHWQGGASANAAQLREALLKVCAAAVPACETDSLKQILTRLALPCDTVLDLHCDGESVMHLYTGCALAEACGPLASLLGASAVLTAEVSGDNPFDEALSRPWWEASKQFGVDFGPGCLAATVELRGEADVSDRHAQADAQALLAFAALRGVLIPTGESDPDATRPVRCTPFAGVEPLVAPISGVIVFDRKPGDQISAGERVARVLNPATGEQRDVIASRPGLLYARVAQRTILAGRRVAKVAGETAFRSGTLLSP